MMYCPGVGDNTSNVAIMMLLASQITKNNTVPGHGLLFVFSTGEEGLGNLKGIRHVMEDYEGKVEEVVAVDGAYSCVTNDAVGSLRYRVSVRTEGGHSYGKFGNRNAIQVLSSIVNTLYEYQVPKKGKNTYNVGTFSGGTSINSIAQYAEMLFEYRSDVLESLNEMNHFFWSVIETAKNADDVQIEVELLGERPCKGDVDEEKLNELTKRARDVIERETGKRVPVSAGSTDCNIPLSIGIPAICFGGHMGIGTHTREEHLSIRELELGMKIVTDFLMTYFPGNSNLQEMTIIEQ